jgi:hypothetical protein
LIFLAASGAMTVQVRWGDRSNPASPITGQAALQHHGQPGAPC